MWIKRHLSTQKTDLSTGICGQLFVLNYRAKKSYQQVIHKVFWHLWINTVLIHKTLWITYFLVCFGKNEIGKGFFALF